MLRAKALNSFTLHQNIIIGKEIDIVFALLLWSIT